jgi:hypothetical protein
VGDIVYEHFLRCRHYAVDIVCPRCREMHQPPNGVLLDDGPESTGSVGDYGRASPFAW